MFGVIAVACVGYGTVRVVPPVSAVARACAIKVVPRMKFTTGRPKPKSANPEPVIVKLAGGDARSIGFGVIPLTVGAGRVSLTVSVALPISVKGGVGEVACHTWACTGPADSPGRFGVIAVACVGNGTVRVVLPVSPVARAWAISVVPRMKFTTGSPKPRFAKPVPVIVKLAGGDARSIGFGVMPVTLGAGRVSSTVRPTLPIRLKVGVAEICCHTWAWTEPADSPGMLGVIAVACVGNGTVRVVLPASAVARACAINVVPFMKFTTGKPKPRFAKPAPVIVNVTGGAPRSIEAGKMPIPLRESFAINAALPISVKELVPVCCQTCASTRPTDNPGMFGVIAVACVGNGTVRVALPLSAVARACAIKVVPRMKFTTGRPKPRSAKPVPVIVKLAGGVARSIGFGVIPLTLGAGRVSFTVSVVVPIRVKGGALEVCCQTWACTGPAESPDMFGVIAVACVGNGTVRVVLPVSAVARACAINVVPRMKLTIGRPNPRFAKPLPLIVKLAGGVARSIVLGVMPLTPAALVKVAVTVCGAFTVRLQVPVPVQLPLQPLKDEPAAGVAVRVTPVPLANAAEHVTPQLMPAGELVTVPVPAPAVLTLSVKI